MKNKFVRVYLITLFVFSFSIAAQAQNLKNPAEKYLNIHKNYLNAQCPLPSDGIKHFVYFSRDRHGIKGHAFLNHEAFLGAQIMYSWRQLEPKKGVYNFSFIEEDVKYLKKYGKKLFIQLQDATFNVEYNPVPKYLGTDKYAGGAVLHYEHKNPAGWVAKRWDSAVQERFGLLLRALGNRFDGEIEGINLQETAINIQGTEQSDFSEKAYVEGLRTNMLELKKAFPKSTSMIYANFMPGE